MSKNTKIFVFTHYDLDGVCSFLVTKWAFPAATIEHKSLAIGTMRDEVIKWLLYNDFNNYDHVFFLDLDVTDLKDLIDKKNVIIIDHHKSSVDSISKMENAKTIIKEYSSCVRLVYKAFKKMFNINLTDAQKQIVLLGDDYDSYAHQIPESKILNVVFWHTQKGFETFIETYKNGFVEFTAFQKNMYELFLNELLRTIKNCNFFGGEVEIGKKSYKVVATFASEHINDIATYMVKKYDSDIVLVVNDKSNRISIRKKNDTEIDLSKFAEKICDGGGQRAAAGGIITPKFLEFTKLLKPL